MTSLVLAAGLALAACGGQGEAVKSPTRTAPTAAEVTIRGVAFAPRTITVQRGVTVTWVNDDPVEHTVTSGRQAVQGVPGVGGGAPARASGLFDATLDQRGERFSFSFERPGRYDYFCRVHPGMTALVVVS